MVSGRPPNYPVYLSDEEIRLCQQFLLAHICKTLELRCHILLALSKCEAGLLNYGQIAASFCVTRNFLTRISRIYAEEGIEGVLTIKRNSASNVANLKLDARIESFLVAMACTPPPAPYVRWTIDLLTEELNRRKNTKFGRSTVWRALQRNKLRPHLSEYWCIPTITELFILRMERVLYLYSLPYDSDYPVVCMDEVALQLVRDVRERLDTAPEYTEKLDYEYERMGTKNVFVFVEPKTGRYYIRATDSRTAVDWAYEIRTLVLHLYPKAVKIILISDNLNIHCLESLYKAFPPEEAREIAERIIFEHTPIHASWLNMAEIGINVVKKECIGRRFRTEDEAAELPARLKEWEENKNGEQKPFCWKFTVEKAREHPHLYKLEGSPESSAGKYGQENALCVISVEADSIDVLSSAEKDDGDIIDLYRSVDEKGVESWSLSLEEKKVVLHEPIGKREIAPLLRQRNTQDGWKIPFPSKPRQPTKTDDQKEQPEPEYDLNFVARGEDVVAVYKTPYDKMCPVVCITKKPYDIETQSSNAWVGKLDIETKAGQMKKAANSEEQTEQGKEEKQDEEDNRLGLTFVYNPFTGDKIFHISDWSDDLSWGQTCRDLVHRMYPEAERIKVVVCREDVVKEAALERVCTVDEALRIDLKLEVHEAPVNGRWLNFAEEEAIGACRQCLKDGVSTIEQVAAHMISWQRRRSFVVHALTLESFRKAFSRVYRPCSSPPRK